MSPFMRSILERSTPLWDGSGEEALERARAVGKALGLNPEGLEHADIEVAAGQIILAYLLDGSLEDRASELVCT